MICPHCHKTIREEERYLMSRNPEDDMVWTPKLRAIAMYVLMFVAIVATLVLFTHAT